MKNTMKKILGIALVLLILVSVMPMTYAEETKYKTGDIIQFGSYPQSKVTDEALVAELNALAPEWEDWTSYGYYSGNGTRSSMKQGDWMRYTDIIYNDHKYRGVKFTQYRPRENHYKPSNSLQDNNNYYIDTIYWFKFELLTWRILDTKTGLVMSEDIVDAQPYCNTLYYDTDAPSNHQCFGDLNYSNYASDYVSSSIRQWLNYDFYNSAFNDLEKQDIMISNLNNVGYYTSKGVSGYEAFDSEPTEDNVFLLSYRDMVNVDYGFSSDSRKNDKARVVDQFNRSDYAECQGLNTEKLGTKWMLRSPGMSSSTSCIVDIDGSSNSC